MSCRLSHRVGAGMLAVGVCLSTARAEDKPKEEKKPEPPQVAISLPFVLKTGVTNKVVLRGQNLTNVTELRFTNALSGARAVIGAKTKAEVPKDADAKKVGDTQITAEIFLPAETSFGTNWFVVVSPNGMSEPRPLLLLPAAGLVEEREPNGGFREAQPLAAGQSVFGFIKDAGDVDVFQFEGKAGQVIRLEVMGAFLGSTLDSLLTLHDAQDRVLASNDDARGGRDSLLERKLTASGIHYASLVDANDKAGPTHAYLLRVTVH